MAFCETFKYYRKNKGYTQEEIANLLSVTAQAVSKWEMGVSMPDISLIVPIANIFGISTDLLLENFSKTEDDITSEIDTINSLNYKFDNKGFEANYNNLIEILKINPESEEALKSILNLSAMWLGKYSKEIEPKQIQSIINNAEIYAKRLQKQPRNDYYSHCVLCDIYSKCGDDKKFSEQLEYLSPDGRYTKDRTLTVHYYSKKEYSKAIEHVQKSIFNTLWWLFFDIERLAGSTALTTLDTDLRNKIYKIEYDILSALSFPKEFLVNYVNVALKLAQDNDKNTAYKYLDELAEKLLNVNKYFTDNTLLFNQITTNSKHSALNKEALLVRLNKWHCFDKLRYEERFKDIIKKIESCDYIVQ